jgi:hypothetical protein
MKGFVLAIVLVAACIGSKKKQATTETGSAAPPVLTKKVSPSFGISPQGSSAEIFLQITDETGKQTSYPVGTYEGTCQVVKPAAEMNALTGVNCTAGSGGTELHAVVSGASIVVLKLRIELGTVPDPMAREEVTRVKAPDGAAIEAP